MTVSVPQNMSLDIHACMCRERTHFHGKQLSHFNFCFLFLLLSNSPNGVPQEVQQTVSIVCTLLALTPSVCQLLNSKRRVVHVLHPSSAGVNLNKRTAPTSKFFYLQPQRANSFIYNLREQILLFTTVDPIFEGYLSSWKMQNHKVVSHKGGKTYTLSAMLSKVYFMLVHIVYFLGSFGITEFIYNHFVHEILLTAMLQHLYCTFCCSLMNILYQSQSAIFLSSTNSLLPKV